MIRALVKPKQERNFKRRKIDVPLNDGAERLVSFPKSNVDHVKQFNSASKAFQQSTQFLNNFPPVPHPMSSSDIANEEKQIGSIQGIETNRNMQKSKKRSLVDVQQAASRLNAEQEEYQIPVIQKKKKVYPQRNTTPKLFDLSGQQQKNTDLIMASGFIDGQELGEIIELDKIENEDLELTNE